jgi:GGDEF domain-containing protein
MGGDEFTVILTEVKTSESAEHVAKNILNSLLEPFELNGTGADF